MCQALDCKTLNKHSFSAVSKKLLKNLLFSYRSWLAAIEVGPFSFNHDTVVDVYINTMKTKLSNIIIHLNS